MKDPVFSENRFDPEDVEKVEFFQLIPKGRGFEQNRDPGQGSESKTTIRSKKRISGKRLLRIFGYRNLHRCDKEQMLYIKSLFILDHRPAGGDKKNDTKDRIQKEALKLLLADQDLLFKDGDPVYRSRYQNKAILSERRAVKRQFHSEEIREYLLWKAMAQQAGDGREQIELLLRAIVHAAAENRSSVYDWLYSDRHLGVTEQNRAEYAERIQLDEDGYLQNGAKEIASQRAWKRFNKRMRSEHDPWDIWRLDLSKCVKSFKAILPSDIDAAFITPEFCEMFIQKYLAEYIHAQQILKVEIPESGTYFDQARADENFRRCAARYDRLATLETGFMSFTKTKLDNNTDITFWGIGGGAKERELSAEIAQRIHEFFENIGMPLREPPGSCLAARIDWVLHSHKMQCYQHTEKPFLLLAMVLACRKRIVQDDGIEFDLDGMFPCYFTQISKAKQRYAEVRLLHRIHQIFELTEEESVQSWNTYFSQQGKEIYSIKELAFWRKLLGGKYERIPVIGYQLCFLEYCEDCLPLHYETLSYRSVSDAHMGGYKRFWDENAERINKLEEKVEGRHISRYSACWKLPGQTNEDRRSVLKTMLTDFEECPVIKDCPNDEYKCLVIETAIRGKIRDKAQKKLRRWFKEVYNCSLEGCFKSIDPDVSQRA